MCKLYTTILYKFITTTRPLYLKYRPSKITTPLPEVTTIDPTRRGASSNYLSLKTIATPRDRGGSLVTVTSSRLPETIYGSRGKVNREATTASGKEGGVGTGPQVEPGSDLRELEGEVNREGSLQEEDKYWTSGGDGRTSSSGSECNRGHSIFYGNIGMYFGCYRLYGFVWSINGYRYISTLKRRLFKIKKHKKKKRKKAWSRMSLIPWKPIKIDEKFKYQMPSKVRRIVKERRRRNKGNRTLRIPRQR